MTDKFEEELKDLQTLVIDQSTSLKKVLELLEDGNEEGAKTALSEALDFKDDKKAPEWVWGVELGEIGKPIQIIKTGEFKHPQYGDISISESDLSEMVKWFNSGVRGQQIPVDIDHKHEMGAVGWFKELKGPVKIDDGHALFATIEWNDKGAELTKGGAFKYFSPHFGAWKDPESGKSYNNVLMSGAITNFPFLKGMQPLAFNELEERMADNEEMVALKQQVAEMATGFTEIKNLVTELAEKVKDPEPKPEGEGEGEGNGDSGDGEKSNSELTEAKLSEIIARETKDLQTKLTEAESQLKLIERDKRQMRFREMATGKHGDDYHWIGDVDTHVEMMETLADAAGEDSDKFKKYVALQESHAKQVHESNLFREIGSSGATLTEDEQLDATVKRLMESDPKMTQAQATDKALSENPKFYAAYNKRHMKRVAEAGG